MLIKGDPNHWVSIYVDKVYDKEFCYYDSYGKDNSHVKDLAKQYQEMSDLPFRLKYKYNAKQYQDYDTDTCALFAMNYLISRYFGHDHAESSFYTEDKAEKAKNILFEDL
mgnify:CR=1 FL=1